MVNTPSARRNIFFILTAISILLLCSCHRAVMKRKYRPGFFVENKKYYPDPQPGIQTEKLFNSNSQNTEKKSEQQVFCIEKTGIEHSDSTGAFEKKLFMSNKHDNNKSAFNFRFFNKLTLQKVTAVPQAMHCLVHKSDPENSLVQKPLSLFWIVVLLVLVLYLAVILFAAESLLPLGHVLGIIFAGLLLLWLLRVF